MELNVAKEVAALERMSAEQRANVERAQALSEAPRAGREWWEVQ